mgnify:CR=1 FL=1
MFRLILLLSFLLSSSNILAGSAFSEHSIWKKEADRIQSAINAMKYLSSKSQRILNNAMLNEHNKENTLSRNNIKDFISKLKKGN